MATTMSPSQITPGQSAKLQKAFAASLRKANPFSSEAQDLIENSWDEVRDEVEDGMTQALNRVLERKRNVIVRRVRVDRTRAPRQVLDDTGRNVYCDNEVVKTMPKGEGEEVDVTFFKPEPSEYTRPGWMSDDGLEKALARRGLKQCDPVSQAEVNKQDPAFADEHPNGTHWKDAGGNWCFATFRRWRNKRYVNVNRNRGSDWGDGCWFAGLRK